MYNQKIDQDFPRKIRELRRRLDMTQIEFAAFCDLSKGLIGQWESGVKLPGRESIDRVVAKTGVSRDWLLGTAPKSYSAITTQDSGEIELLIAYRRLPSRGKENALKLCRVIFDTAGEAA